MAADHAHSEYGIVASCGLVPSGLGFALEGDGAGSKPNWTSLTCGSATSQQDVAV
jgi:hypothetical protein